MNLFKIGKGVQQGYILSPCLCNLYAEFTMQTVKLNYKLESRFLGEISTTSDMQMCCCLVSQLYLTLCDCSTPGYPAFTISWSLLKLMSMKLEMPSNHLTLCCPFSSCLQPFPASRSFLMIQRMLAI